MYDVAELIQEYSKNPVNNYEMLDADVVYQEWNPICGDGIVVYLKIEKNKLKNFSFSGDTSMVTTAAVSMLAEEIIAYDIEKILSLDYNFVKEELGLEVSPRRERSAVLGLLATRNAIHEYKKDWILDDFDDLIEED